MSVDPAKVQRMLGSPELSWLVDRIRGRLERGEPIDGTLTLVGATPSQRRAAARLLGRHPGRSTTLSISLPAVAAELWRAAAAPNLISAVEALGGPVRNLAAERAAGLQQWGDVLSEVRASPLANQPWYAEWVDTISRDGTMTRLLRQGHGDVIGQAAAVLDRLPSTTEPGSTDLPTLAAAVTGNEHALADGPLPGLVLHALALREGVGIPDSSETEQALWIAAGVAGDDVASQVLVLNLRAKGEPVGRWLNEAAGGGQPFRLTLRQLLAAPVQLAEPDVYVCSSSALVMAAADELGASCPPLICTEGDTSVACARLLQAAVASGSSVHWHSDFSWAGLRRTQLAIKRLRAQPWRMSVSAYQAAITGPAIDPLRGRTESSPWDPRLAEMMRLTGRGVHEERLISGLLDDLAAQGHSA